MEITSARRRCKQLFEIQCLMTAAGICSPSSLCKRDLPTTPWRILPRLLPTYQLSPQVTVICRRKSLIQGSVWLMRGNAF